MRHAELATGSTTESSALDGGLLLLGAKQINFKTRCSGASTTGSPEDKSALNMNAIRLFYVHLIFQNVSAKRFDMTKTQIIHIYQLEGIIKICIAWKCCKHHCSTVH